MIEEALDEEVVAVGLAQAQFPVNGEAVVGGLVIRPDAVSGNEAADQGVAVGDESPEGSLDIAGPFDAGV